VEPQEFIEAGDQMLVRTPDQRRGKGSVQIDSPAYHLFRLRAGKVVRLGLSMTDREQALKDPGLSR
jgi:hypothetical protein